MESTLTDMYVQSEDVKELFAALAEFSKLITPIDLDGKAEYTTKNGLKTFNFPTMNNAIIHTKQLREDLGLFIHQVNVGNAGVSTTLYHLDSGQFIRSYSYMALPMKDPQSHGSAITYLRRYSYLTILGLVPNNDSDGAQVEGEETTAVTLSKSKVAKLEAKILEAKAAGVEVSGYEKMIKEKKLVSELTEDIFNVTMTELDKDIQKAKD